MHIHFIKQVQEVTPGAYLTWAQKKQARITCTRLWLYETLPESTPDMLIVLGGPQNPSSSKAEYPFYYAPAQEAYIRRCVNEGKLVVGSCLGAQLLGEAMGAPFEHSPNREIGPTPLHLTAEGKSDPHLKGFPETFLSAEWHNDMPGLTPDCSILAESEGCPQQIIRYAPNAYGLQCHMEFTKDIVEGAVNWDKATLDESQGMPYVKSRDEILSFDYFGMNALLHLFLDAFAASELFR